jgi:chemotaxis protein histidine kinase CheA
MIDPGLSAAVGKAADVADKLGIFQKLFAKLIGDPNTAARQLNLALFEIRKTMGSLRDTILEITYLGVPDQDVDDVRRALDRIQGGELFADVIRAKGSCHKICNIYHRHLKAWFKDVVFPDEAESLRLLFEELCDSDGWAVQAAEVVLQQAKPLVEKIRGLLQKGKLGDAQKTVAEFEEDLRPQLKKIQAAIEEMFKLENQFIEQKRLT